MKLQILKQGEQPVENYKAIFVQPWEKTGINLNFDGVSDNECTEILAGDILNFCEKDQIPLCIAALMKKLRINGVLTVGGTDMRLFCKSVINNMLNEDQAAGMIGDFRSMSTMKDALEPLGSYNLEILSTTLSAAHYTVKARRLS